MKWKITYFCAALWFCWCGLSGCAVRKEDFPPPGADPAGQPNPERLIIRGTVKNTAQQALEGIRVDIYGVRDEKEGDVLSYNYAFTDSLGNYTICRYMGRTIPVEVVVVASDPRKIYQEKTAFMPVQEVYNRELENKQSVDALEIRTDFILAPLE